MDGLDLQTCRRPRCQGKEREARMDCVGMALCLSCQSPKDCEAVFGEESLYQVSQEEALAESGGGMAQERSLQELTL